MILKVAFGNGVLKLKVQNPVKLRGIAQYRDMHMNRALINIDLIRAIHPLQTKLRYTLHDLVAAS